MITLERMRWWHLPDVLRIERAVFPETAWTEGHFWSELARVPSARDYTVGLQGQEVVGYVGINIVAPDSDIQTIAVAPHMQQQGLGHRMMEHAFSTATARGCTQMFLEVREDNGPAIAMYERFGFERLQMRRDYYGPGMHGIVMRRRLP